MATMSLPERYLALIKDALDGAVDRPGGSAQMGRERCRLDHLQGCLDRILDAGIAGDFLVAGCGRGGGALFLRAYLAAREVGERIVWVADTFAGAPPASCAEDAPIGVDQTAAGEPAIELFRIEELFGRHGLLDDQVRFLPGLFRHTLAPSAIEQLALLKIGAARYESTMDVLAALYDSVVPGGFVIVDDYAARPACRQAVDDFRRQRAVDAPLETIDAAGALWRKPGEPGRRAVPVAGAAEAIPAGHFYSPLVDLVDLAGRADVVFDPERPLPAIDFGLARQEALLRQLATYYDDLPFADLPGGGLRYGYVNDQFSYFDAILLATMIRHLRPRRIIEVGSGHSSCVMLDVNERYFANGIECTFIEPHPERLLANLKPEDRVRLHAVPVQSVDPALFATLQAGDILFIDSTHVSKAGSDVNFHFFDVFPCLQPGVVIFMHDIFHAFEYPPEWFFTLGRSWNEAYLLRAFLSYNDAFEILLFPGYLRHHRPGLCEALMPLAARNPGGSFWMRKRLPRGGTDS